MTPSSIANIRQRVAQMRVALLEPGANLPQLLVGLAQAVGQMRQVTVPTTAEERALLDADLQALQLDLRRVQQLARNGENFWLAWRGLVGQDSGANAGYTPAGEEACGSAPGVIAVTG